MKKLMLLLITLTIYGCNKPKTVLICGDHICVNKAEAEQFFEDNLTLEVKVIDKKKPKEINLIEINLKSDSDEKKEIAVFKKTETNRKLKELSDEEIKNKKAEINKRKKFKSRQSKNEKIEREVKLRKSKEKEKTQNKPAGKKKIVNKTSKKITDICTILEKCSIDEISKYLVKQGNEREFPDITIRENK